MLFFACRLMMLATAAAKLKIPKIPSKVNLLVTAVSFIECNSVPPPGTETSVHGEVKLMQLPLGGPTAIFVNISGLPPNTMHGFHIHEYGDTVTDGCQSTGSHYNPLYQAHGAPQDKVRHVGDLGNLISNHNGVVIFKIVDPLVSLVGPLSVVGRAIVIHEKIDDLGRGAGPAAVESLKTGNAGARLGCGAILLAPLDMLDITDLKP